ncbi:hypothetical protein HanOQP8_Chr03g0127071 [Helianthus annuus]|nr:hypothetical protein HanHA89_Chr03g0126541 [Helianthus annuus]KAJ0775830.1 hypothetical protein HanOQP8_Chr03g0127071 [Helianthus annuus]KAJ0818317.1 hypothetical protein HanLR1_Chr00c0354g0743921 [Helianthus annuus]
MAEANRPEIQLKINSRPGIGIENIIRRLNLSHHRHLFWWQQPSENKCKHRHRFKKLSMNVSRSV